jgi:hypothetical protein
VSAFIADMKCFKANCAAQAENISPCIPFNIRRTESGVK